jgi:ADP-heptose:LPS heptosyltransferase
VNNRPTDFISRFFIRFPWIAWFLLDNALFRNNLFRKIILYRPELFGAYYRWKPVWFARKAILIIKTDAIGDYMLFRRALKAISNSKKYRGYQIYLLGNEVWAGLSKDLDGEFVNGYFWLNRNACKNPADPFYRQKLVFEINRMVFEKLIYFSFSRENLTGDWLAGHITAKEKISTEGDLLCQTAEERQSGNVCYSSLFPLPNQVYFELEKNKKFTEWLLDEKIAGDFISVPKTGSSTKKIVFFPGASAAFRQWPVDSFVSLGRIILEKTDFSILIAGGSEDRNKAGQILESLGDERVASICGTASLSEFFHMLGDASLLISNETSGVHMAVALGIPTLCISNGNHYGRFNPYEQHGFVFVKTIFPNQVLQKTEAERLKLWKDGSILPISEIGVSEVWVEVERLLPKD